mmetsp:Transcript_72703/g.116016  ORF Transcript_72703/g.116016 Transcript_72703/m.116016 type:complete len:487 (-) Transcript_72703:57-1517(-)
MIMKQSWLQCTCVVVCVVVHHYSRCLADERPNILLLFPDQWRFDWADNYYLQDLDIDTPTFKAVASNGTRFVNTIVGSPVCAPSRGCIATGKEYDYTGLEENMEDLPENQTTFYRLLQQNGYYTIITGKDDLTKKTGVGVNGTYRAAQLGYSAQCRCLDKTALAAMFPTIYDPFSYYLANQSLYNITDECMNDCCTQQFDMYECPEALPVPSTAYQDNWVTWNTLDLLEKKPANQPWFMQVNFPGPHPPFIILQAMNDTVNNRYLPLPMNSTFNASDMEIARRDYTAEVENLDKQFSLIIDKIAELNEMNNTIICISSDHGEMLGDFNLWQKEKPWIASTNVPLVCSGPGIVAAARVETYVTNMDLAGTFLDYSNTATLANMTTQSLRKFLNGTWSDESNEYRSYVSSGLSNFRLVVQPVNATVTWKYICCQHQCPGRSFANSTHNGYTKLLFNLVDDPYEWNNVAHDNPHTVHDLQQLLPPGFCT